MKRLKEFANSFIQDGHLVTNVYKEEDGGFKIEFLENDSPYCVTSVFTVYTSGADNSIGFVEHGYHPLTSANLRYVKALTTMVNQSVEIKEEDIVIEYPLSKE